MYSKNLSIICISTDSWGILKRRRQHLITELAKYNSIEKILFINPPIHIPYAIKTGIKNIKLHNFLIKTFKENNKITIVQHLSFLPFVRFDVIRKINSKASYYQIKTFLNKLPQNNLILWITSPLDFYLSNYIQHNLLCFDLTDEWSEFEENKQWAKEIIKFENKLLEKADIVFAVSDYLLKKAITKNKKTYLIPNGVESSIIDKKIETMPDDIAKINSPIIGYIGTIDKRIDVNLIKKLLMQIKNASVVMIGPCSNKELNNINGLHLLGLRPYHLLPAYIKAFDICILPHLKNKLTESMDPIKIYEYFAQGKPVVSMNVGEINKYGDLIYCAKTDDEFINYVKQIINFGEPSEKRVERINKVKCNTWEIRANKILKIFESYIYTKKYG